MLLLLLLLLLLMCMLLLCLFIYFCKGPIWKGGGEEVKRGVKSNR